MKGGWSERVTSRRINKQEGERLSMREVGNMQWVMEVGAKEEPERKKRSTSKGEEK